MNEQLEELANRLTDLEEKFRRHDHSGIETDEIGLGDDIDLTAEVTGTLPVANGGTGAATLTDGGLLLGNGTGAIQAMGVLADGTIPIGDGTTDPTTLAAFTGSTGQLKHERGGIEADISAVVKGDLLVGTGAGTIGLKNVGANDQVLTADSTQAGGVKWAAPSVSAVQKLTIITTDNTVGDASGNEEAFFSYTVPGGTLGTSNAIHVRMAISASNTSSTNFVIRAKYGGSTLETVTLPNSSISGGEGFIDFYLIATGATNSQESLLFVDYREKNGLSNDDHLRGKTASAGHAIDSTTDQTLEITGDPGGFPSNDMNMSFAIITKIA
jgi:hypothetical protein